MQLDDRFFRKAPISLDERAIGYRAGFKAGIFTGSSIVFLLFVFWLIIRQLPILW